MNDDDKQLQKDALEFVKKNKKQLFEDLVAGRIFDGSSQQVAIFMAGTPGAGKTEVAQSLGPLFATPPLRIDADEFRTKIPGYNGANSDIIQPAASVAVDKVLDQVYKNKYPFILDGTFAVGKALVNLKRAIRKGYSAQVYFVYQDPLDAWRFTKIREKKEGRRVPKEAFVNAYFASRQNVKSVKQELGSDILLTLIIKNYSTGERKILDNVDDIEKYIPKTYNRDELEGLIND